MATRVDIPPVNYTFKVQAMSKEKLPLAAEFTIGGPRTDDNDSMLKFSELISAHDNELLQGIIESETRVVTNSMTMEDIFKDTKDFLQKVSDKVQLQLNQFGLRIYDAKVEQLVDGQKTQMEAADQARVTIEEKKETIEAFKEFIDTLKKYHEIAQEAHSAAAPSTFTHTMDVNVGPTVAVGPTAAATGPTAVAAGPVDVGPAAVAAAAGPVNVGPAAVAATAGQAAIVPVAVAAVAGPVDVGPAAVAVAAAAGPVVIGPAAAAAAGPVAAAVGPPVVFGHVVIGHAIALGALAGCCIIM